MSDTEKKVVTIAEFFKQVSKPDTRKASEKKFGKPVMDVGFCITPSMLMKAQARIGLNPVQFNVVMHLLDQWWTADRLPWPSKGLLAERMNMSPRQVQRQIAELECAGLIQRIGRTRPGKGKTSNEYDLSGLINKMKELEPEFTKAKHEAQARQKALSRPKHKQQA
jgi:predicted transcriptional regulator